MIMTERKMKMVTPVAAIKASSAPFLAALLLLLLLLLLLKKMIVYGAMSLSRASHTKGHLPEKGSVRCGKGGDRAAEAKRKKTMMMMTTTTTTMTTTTDTVEKQRRHPLPSNPVG